MKPQIPLEESLLSHVEQCEAFDPGHFYEAKRPSIKMAQLAGLSDKAIERLYQITLRTEDRTSRS